MSKTDKSYLENKYSELFKSLDCFWAFSNTQFAEGLQNAGGFEKTGTYVSVGGGLHCPSKNVKALIEGMDKIKQEWKTEREKTEQVRLVFVGIDDLNRPVWRDPDKSKKLYFGDVNNLFSWGTTEEEVLKKVETYDLCYFGDHFGCEPMGSSIPDKYYI